MFLRSIMLLFTARFDDNKRELFSAPFSLLKKNIIRLLNSLIIYFFKKLNKAGSPPAL